MKERHNNKERVGLHFIAHTIEEEFGWVFREQSISDVGIDAFVEEAKNGNPTGNFIALQIKSGEGNVSEKERSFTYYISNTHYYYWVNLELPIILTVYIKKKKKKIYWVELSKSKISKTPTRWKIEIPKNQLLNKESESEFQKIIFKSKKKLIPAKSKETEAQKLGKITAIDQVTVSLKFLTEIVNIFREQINKFASQASEATKKEEFELKLRMFRIQCEIQYVLSNYASRALSEINIYAQLFSDALIGFRTKYVILKPLATTEILENEKNELEQLRKLYTAFDKVIEGVGSMRKSIINFGRIEVLKDKSNIKMATLASDQIIEEVEISQKLIQEVLNQSE